MVWITGMQPLPSFFRPIKKILNLTLEQVKIFFPTHFYMSKMLLIVHKHLVSSLPFSYHFINVHFHPLLQSNIYIIFWMWDQTDWVLGHPGCAFSDKYSSKLSKIFMHWCRVVVPWWASPCATSAPDVMARFSVPGKTRWHPQCLFCTKSCPDARCSTQLW